MYLSKMHLDIRNIYAKKCLRDCQIMHRSIQHMFHSSRQESGALYRINPQRLDVYVWSAEKPDCDSIPAGMKMIGCRDFSEIEAGLQEGGCYRFNLLASPCKKVPQEGKKNSRRRFLKTIEERMKWLRNKGGQYGFSVLQVQESHESMTQGLHDKDDTQEIFYKGVIFQGILRIEDVALFKKGWQNGIGPGKAYGQGMLILYSV
ncbi:type I-E CRISPR-associated protein Cas6/Cse3/CasE [Selenomonas sp. KH1T6]|uniref:type I-E CRISPR-associated protein Cas6/Cse3/CasE n=1 Tax=Selenomonas sp. KH1T6 TaxID=3158784 RepID=UPI0008A7D2E7|nr:CRISPR-associated protein, Cse3 family [Selenomonas ruminantium]